MILAIRFSESRSVLLRRLHERDERQLERAAERHAETCRDGANCPLSVLESVLANSLAMHCENRPEIVREDL